MERIDPNDVSNQYVLQDDGELLYHKELKGVDACYLIKTPLKGTQPKFFIKKTRSKNRFTYFFFLRLRILFPVVRSYFRSLIYL